jgi:hypothetical protein
MATLKPTQISSETKLIDLDYQQIKLSGEKQIFNDQCAWSIM